jgi:hypothetical protein
MADFYLKLRAQPSDLPGLIVDLEAGSARAGTWVNRVKTGPTFSQAAATLQPAHAASGVVFTDDSLAAEAAIKATVSEWEWLAVQTPQTPTPSVVTRRLLDGGSLSLATMANGADELGWFDSGSWRANPAGANIAGKQAVDWRLKSADGAVYRNGELLFTGAYGATALPISTALGSAFGGAADFFAGSLHRMLGWTRYLEAYERGWLHGWVKKNYGITMDETIYTWAPSGTSWARVVTADWNDPANVALDRASRLNPHPAAQHKYLFGSKGRVQVVAVVGGVEGPPDSALGGRLFTAYFAERPGADPIIYQHTARSSVLEFDAQTAGHYVLGVVRPDGGTVLLHYDCSGKT